MRLRDVAYPPMPPVKPARPEPSPCCPQCCRYELELQRMREAYELLVEALAAADRK